jgi:hypothetical protein
MSQLCTNNSKWRVGQPITYENPYHFAPIAKFKICIVHDGLLLRFNGQEKRGWTYLLI